MGRYTITLKQYNYLLPVFGICAGGVNRLHSSKDAYYFLGSHSDYLDMLNRCIYLD